MNIYKATANGLETKVNKGMKSWNYGPSYEFLVELVDLYEFVVELVDLFEFVLELVDLL